MQSNQKWNDFCVGNFVNEEKRAEYCLKADTKNKNKRARLFFVAVTFS